ncbi:MAG: tRNA (adenosine(37)-N6)-threonylcarbamoyltransferase complex dimerization subunit type 1 TsaB [Rhodothermales bacterium]
MPFTLLAIETATDVCSVALTRDRQVVVALTLTRPRAHAETLVPMIQEAFHYGEVTPRTLDAVAVSSGPGSYTGLRIGVSTAKGMAMAVEASLIGVPSLEALAASVAPMAAPGEAICALFNSRRNEVYAALFLQTGEAALQLLAQAAALSLDEVPAWLTAYSGRRLWLVGEGVPRAVPVLQDHTSYELQPLDPTVFAPSATWIARLAFPKYEAGAVENVAGFEPAYLKAFVAKKPKGSIFDKLPF